MTGYRITPIFSETSMGYSNTYRGLAAFVFVHANQSRHFFDVD